MRLVLVNQCPAVADHVCAVRMRSFAETLAARGHQVVLLTEAGETADPESAAGRLAGHDWRRPLRIECARRPDARLDGLHAGRLPAVLRKAVVAEAFLRRGGVFDHWRRGCGDTVDALAERFRPQVVWATFGVTDCWNIAQDLARRAGCPWIADVKDNWENFIPFGLRRRLAARYGDAAAMTALSEAHRGIVETYFKRPAETVYSGFSRADAAADGTTEETFLIVAAGSLYDGAGFTTLVAGIARWLDGGGPGRPVGVAYYGNDHVTARSLAAPLDSRCTLRIEPFVAPTQLRALQATATVNVYPRHAPMLYHHKFIELLATGRPVLCAPGESAECRAIAREVEAPFFSCDDAAAVAAALEAVADGRQPSMDSAALARYSWERQCDALASLFERTAGGSTGMD